MKKYLLVLFMVTGLSIATYPQDKKEIREIDIERLIHSLKFDNDGVKESAINFAGKYRIHESLKYLTHILLNDDNEKLRLLAANALINFGGSDELLEKLRFAAQFDNSSIVRNTCLELIKSYKTASDKRKINRLKEPPGRTYGRTPPTPPVPGRYFLPPVRTWQ